MDGADGQPRLVPLEEWTRAGEGHQGGIQGRREVVDVRDLLARGGGRGGGDSYSLIDRPRLQLQMQVRARTSPGVHEPLGTDRAHLDPVVQPVADGWLQRQRIGAERVEPETQRSRRAQGNPQVLRVLTLQVIESVDRRRVYLDQAQHELGGEAHRTGRFLAAALQELVGPLRWMPGVLEQEEFLLEPGPSIQQPVAFTHPVPECLDVFSIFCGENATPDVGSRLRPWAEIRAARNLSVTPTCNLRCGREGGQRSCNRTTSTASHRSMAGPRSGSTSRTSGRCSRG